MEIEEWLGQENQLGIDIWKRKYCNNGETFEQWLSRISAGNQEVIRLVREKKFLFGGRILANRGLEYEGRKITLSNCYVIEPPEDEIESIFECAKKLARTYSYGGGCGIDISRLSPRGARINNAAKETSGAVSFMDLYSLVTDLIGQNGRRGALMISIDCSHPDVEHFIDIKTDLQKVTKANISIRISGKFSVDVFSILIHHAHGTVLKPGTIHQGEKNHISFHSLCLQLLPQLYSRLDTHIFRIVNSPRDQHYRPFLSSADQSNRNLQLRVYDFHPAGNLLARLCT